jgi:hypothetical protein
MGVLNGYVRYLPPLKDRPKTIPTTKKGNIPFGKAELSAVCQNVVSDQYILTHLTVPESSCALLLDLEAIKRVMVEKKNEMPKAKGKATAACPNAKSILYCYRKKYASSHVTGIP